jgi:hypothetical protein
MRAGRNVIYDPVPPSGTRDPLIWIEHGDHETPRAVRYIGPIERRRDVRAVTARVVIAKSLGYPAVRWDGRAPELESARGRLTGAGWERDQRCSHAADQDAGSGERVHVIDRRGLGSKI